jgi:hypothetical protein
MKLIKQYLFYLLRWQLSTPILALVLMFFNVGSSPIVPTVVANLIGGLIFFWVDKWIFKPKQ